jgi:hypothetical protein
LSPPQHVVAPEREERSGRMISAFNYCLCCDVNVSARPIIGIVMLCCVTAGCGFRSGNKVLIPDGYTGWVRIYYREANSPALHKEDSHYLVTVDGSGSAHTSSLREPGYGNDEYFYVSTGGFQTKLKLQGVEDRADDIVHDFTYQSEPKEVTLFFVGPRSAVKTKPRPDL